VADTVLISSFFAFPPFNKKFGVEYEPGKYQVTAPWQSGLSNGARIGEILGLLINGIVAERYGYRFTMIASLIAMIAFIFIPFFAQNVETLVAGTVLMGIPVSAPSCADGRRWIRCRGSLLPCEDFACYW
jgi:SP family general alpha glucoside:H+ symporter-like MFS transporter